MAKSKKKKLNMNLACSAEDGDLKFYLQKESGTISLMAKTQGLTQYILAINIDGRIFRHNSISPKLGLPLDKQGRVCQSKKWI